MKDFLTTQAINLQTAAVNISAQSFDPGVTVQSDAPFLEPLRTVAGWGMALGLVFVVLIVIIGGVLIATGKITNTPGNQSKGFMVVLFSLVGAAIIAGASAVVFFGTTIGLGTGGPSGTFTPGVITPALGLLG